MSWSFIDDKVIKKTRKDHRCEYCQRTIPKGSPNIYHWKGTMDNEMQSSYACHWCEKNSYDLVDQDGIIANFAERLVDIFDDELGGGFYFGGFDGDYAIFNDKINDKEIARIYCPVIKEEK